MLREAAPADIPRVRELMLSVPGFWDPGWPADVLERVVAADAAITLVYENGTTLSGFICGYDVGFRGYLSELVVSPGAQGTGIGSLLLAELERRLAARGCPLVIADVWRDAEGFYRRRGWAPPDTVLLRKRFP